MIIVYLLRRYHKIKCHMSCRSHQFQADSYCGHMMTAPLYLIFIICHRTYDGNVWYIRTEKPKQLTFFRNKAYRMQAVALSSSEPTYKQQKYDWCYLNLQSCTGVELGTTVKQLQLVVTTGLKPGTSRFQVQHPNHSAFTRLRTLYHKLPCHGLASIYTLTTWNLHQQKGM